MTESAPTLSTRYYLTLEESQDGFALATFGKTDFTLSNTFGQYRDYYLGLFNGPEWGWPLLCGFGCLFLILQGIMRYWFLPMMFKRQFVKYQFGKVNRALTCFRTMQKFSITGVVRSCIIMKYKVLLLAN